MRAPRRRLLLSVLAALAAAACREPPARDVRLVLGTSAEVRAVGLKPPLPGMEAAFGALAGVEGALKRGGGGTAPELAPVERHAREVAEAAELAAAPDLEAAAQGHAVDLALRALRAAGARKGLVNLGGRSLGVFGEPLTLAVRDPESLEGPRWGSFTIQDAALATAGGPGSGPPARGVLSATVLARTAMDAAALAAAARALGPEEGLALLARRGAAGFVLYRDGGRKVLRATPGFAAAQALEASPGVELRP
jgi:hypothetical protein